MSIIRNTQQNHSKFDPNLVCHCSADIALDRRHPVAVVTTIARHLLSLHLLRPTRAHLVTTTLLLVDAMKICVQLRHNHNIPTAIAATADPVAVMATKMRSIASVPNVAVVRWRNHANSIETIIRLLLLRLRRHHFETATRPRHHPLLHLPPSCQK